MRKLMFQVWKHIIKEFVKNIVWEQNRQVFTPPFGEIFSFFPQGEISTSLEKYLLNCLIKNELS